jgi:4-amino-4-deoxy-L-arabinose transferase-like glycosyltransferase
VKTNPPASARPAPGRRLTAGLILALAAVLILSAVVRVRLLDTPLERDEGEYAYVAQLLLHGDWPYLHAYSMKLPGIFLIYAGILKIFGATAAGIHLGLLLAVSLSTILLFLLARRLLPDGAAVAAAAAFSLLSAGSNIQGLSANTEPFLLPFVLGGFLLLLRGLDARRPGPAIFLSGLCFGAAFLVKQHGAAFGLFGGLYLLGRLAGDKGIPGGRKAGRLAFFAGGALLPLAAVVLAAAGLGIFPQLRFYAFEYARTYVSHVTVDEALLRIVLSLKNVAAGAPLIWALAAGGFWLIARRRGRDGRRVFWIGLTAASFLALVPGFFFRPHYYILALPVVALLAGAAAEAVWRSLAASGLCRKTAAPAAAALLALVFGSTAFIQRELLFAAGPRQAIWATYGPLPFTFEATRWVAGRLAPLLGSGRTVAVIGSEPQLYFYLGCQAPTPFLYFYYLTEEHPYAAAMRAEFIRDLEKARPDFLVYAPSWEDEHISAEGYEQLARWYEGFRDRDYELLGLAEVVSRRTTIFKWGDEARSHKIRSPQRILVYRRKSPR